jgi:hypothetical protein
MIAEAPDDGRETPLTQNDAALVADFLKRESEARNQPGGNEDDTSEPKGGETGRVDEPKKDEKP